MADLLNIARTGIMAANAGLQTTGHNIANANTEGYHKQRVELYALDPAGSSGIRFGLGVEVGDVARMQNDIVSRQRRDVESQVSSLNQFEQLGTQVSEMFGSSGYQLDEAMDGYFNAVRESADNPASIPLRTVVLQRAEELANRFNSVDDRLGRMEVDLAPQIALEVEQINEIGAQLVEVNKQLGTTYGNDSDLLDRRDMLLDNLASKITIDTRFDEHGQVSVGIAKGQTIIDGGHHNELKITPDPKSPELFRVQFDNQGQGVDITDAIQGGALGGILGDSRALLRDTRESVGQLAASLVTEVNKIHSASVDLDGNIGGNFFQPITTNTISDVGNTGNALLSTSIVDGTALQSQSYDITYDGANWDVSDGDGNSLMTGATLPISIDGVEISLTSGGANAGDKFSVSPSLGAASRMALSIDDPRQLALAQPVRAIEQADNSGSATVQNLNVADAGNPGLQIPVLIEFADPPTQYSIVNPTDGSVLAAPVAYTSGDTIAFNGWEATVIGNPAAGDRIAVEGNSDGLASQNLGLIADLQTDKIMAGGNASMEEIYGALVGNVGSRVSSAVSNADAQGRVHQILTDRLENSVGVSLDEEATKMMQYQQLFQASARVIQTVQATFDTLIKSF